MIDSDDVLLLRGPGFVPQTGARHVVVTICQPPDATAFDAYAARHLRPRHALHRTEHTENDYPLLPVRADVDVRVWFGQAEAPAPTWPVQQLWLDPVTTMGDAPRRNPGHPWPCPD
jgi:hypothetical protein